MAKERITPYGIINEAESDHQYVSTFGSTFDETGTLTLRIIPAPAIATAGGSDDPFINNIRYVSPESADAGTEANCDALIGNEKFVFPEPAAAVADANATVPYVLWIEPGYAAATCESYFSFTIRRYSGVGAADLPIFEASSYINTGNVMTAALNLPGLDQGEGAGYGNEVGTGAGELRTLGASGIILNGLDGYGEASIPKLRISGGDTTDVGSGASELKSPEISGYIIRGNSLSGTPELPNLIILGYGPGLYDGQIEGQAVLRPLRASGSGAAGQYFSVDLTLPKLRFYSDQLGLNHTGTGTLILPPLETEGESGINAFGSGSAIFPVMILDGFIVNDLLADLSTGYAIVATCAMNKLNAAVTDWEWNFNSFDRLGTYNFGAYHDGIYLLEGPSDDGSEIGMDVRKLEMDFKSPLLKRATDAFVRLRSDNDYQFTIYADGISKVIDVDDDLDGSHGKKMDLPRGMKGRRLGVAITNKNGADMSIEKLDLEIEVLSRRARR